MTFFTRRLYTSATLLLLCLSLQMVAFGQKTNSSKRGYSRYYSVTVGTGTSYYYGDINNIGDAASQYRPQFNVGFRSRIDEHISIRGEFQYYQIGGDDSKNDNESRAKRNLNFRSNNFELSGIVQYDFVRPAPFQSRYSRRPKANFFVFGDFGLTTNNPTTLYKGERIAVRPLQTEGVSYGSIQPVLPLGIGVRIHLNPDADLIIDYGYRYTFTDYLDDVSGDYAARSSFSDPTALALSDRRGEIDPRFNDAAFAAKSYPHRGNSARNAAYGVLSVKYQYTFSKSQFKRMRKGMKRSFKSRLNRYK